MQRLPHLRLSFASLLALVAIGTSSARTLTAGDITWEGDWAAAKARSASETKVLFLAVNMDGERANDRLATKVYHDKRIVELAGFTVPVIASAHEHSSRTCKRFGTVECSQHQSIDIRVREELLPKDEGGFVVAPQHVFLGPSGDVLLSVPYEINAAELEWCLVEAIRRVDPESKIQASSKARAPKRLVDGGMSAIVGGDNASPATLEEVLELMEQVRKGRMKDREAALRRIMTADEEEARKFISQELRSPGGGRGGGGRGGRGGGGGGGGGGTGRNEAGTGPWAQQEKIIRNIARLSPSSWWVLIEEFAFSKDEDLRSECIAALEQLQAPESVKLIQSGLRKEKDERLEGNWLRALASCAPSDTKVASKILKLAKKDKSPAVQTQAILALGWLAPSEQRTELLSELLEGDAPDMAEAAALAAGLSREEVLKQMLESHAVKAVADIKAALDASLSVWEKGSLEPLGPLIRSAMNDDVPRERFFGFPRR
jgi:uncharacterized membrane protein YgcG